MSDGFAHPLGRGSDAYMTWEEFVEIGSNWLNHLTFLSGFVALFSPYLFG